MNPICEKCNSIFMMSTTSLASWNIFECPSCGNTTGKMVGQWLPTDEDTNRLFADVSSLIKSELNISYPKAIGLAQEYYLKFTNPKFCSDLGLQVQDDDFFHHEGAPGLALRIVCYLVNEKNEKPFLVCVQN